MNQSLRERERVNERFQRRTRRAWTARSVDLAVNVSFVEIRRTDLGDHFHCAGIDQKHRCVFDAAIAIIPDVIGYSSLNRLLFFQIECGDDFIAPVRRLKHLLNKMRRDEFSPRLHARAKFAHRKFRVGVDPCAIVPTGLRDIHRIIIAICM